jgi:hypothetical protein
LLRVQEESCDDLGAHADRQERIMTRSAALILSFALGVPADPVQALRARNQAAGLHLNARTTCPGWLGEPLDVGWALDVLHPRALQPVAAGE